MLVWVKAPGIHDREVDRTRRQRLDPLDEFMLGVALEALERRIALRGFGFQALLDGGERDVSVPAGFAAAEQIEVGPIDEQDSAHWRIHGHYAPD